VGNLCFQQVRRRAIEGAIASKYQCVVSVPWLDARVVPDARAQPVERSEAVRRKLVAPVFVRLLVDMEFAALTRNCCGEKNNVAMRGEARHEGVGARRSNVLSHLQALDQIETALQSKRLRKIAFNELFRWDSKPASST